MGFGLFVVKGLKGFAVQALGLFGLAGLWLLSCTVLRPKGFWDQDLRIHFWDFASTLVSCLVREFGVLSIVFRSSPSARVTSRLLLCRCQGRDHRYFVNYY